MVKYIERGTQMEKGEEHLIQEIVNDDKIVNNNNNNNTSNNGNLVFFITE